MRLNKLEEVAALMKDYFSRPDPRVAQISLLLG